MRDSLLEENFPVQPTSSQVEDTCGGVFGSFLCTAGAVPTELGELGKSETFTLSDNSLRGEHLLECSAFLCFKR